MKKMFDLEWFMNGFYFSPAPTQTPKAANKSKRASSAANSNSAPKSKVVKKATTPASTAKKPAAAAATTPRGRGRPAAKKKELENAPIVGPLLRGDEHLPFVEVV